MKLAPFTTLLAALLISGGLMAQPAAEAPQQIVVTESRFVAIGSDGETLPEAALIGAVIEVGDASAGGYLVRIDDILHDTETPGSVPLTLYKMFFQKLPTREWAPLCDKGPDGYAMAVPMAGVWSRDGSYRPLDDGGFNLSCTSGAHVKCLRLGYAPWHIGDDGESLAPYHQACTRMIRADYCGDGRAHTVPGRIIMIYDRRSRWPDMQYGSFEAIWDENGAICLNKSRVPEKFPLTDILMSCPRLAKAPKECGDQQLRSSSSALLGNRS